VPSADGRSADGATPVSAAELRSLFADLADHPVLILAVSGGPDSTALLWLAARWRKSLKHGPKLVAVTVDHGLRKEAKREAAAVARLARKLGVAHRTVRWQGRKPATGLQEAARMARYRLLAEAARRAGARAVLTAHTLDDQAETVLIRLTRGSGIGGLGAMARVAPLHGDGEISLIRPLLDLPKVRLVATLRRARIGWRGGPGAPTRRWSGPRLTPGPSLLPVPGRRRGRSNFRRTVMRICRPRCRCGCSAAPSRRPAMKGRWSSASSRLCTPRWPLRQVIPRATRGFAALWPALWSAGPAIGS
jgi:tRNA(Ile)-lysidine synthase